MLYPDIKDIICAQWKRFSAGLAGYLLRYIAEVISNSADTAIFSVHVPLNLGTLDI